eukprot:SAG31_NODE_3432_length_4280_cov_1.816073_1_plen_845_part_00
MKLSSHAFAAPFLIAAATCSFCAAKPATTTRTQNVNKKRAELSQDSVEEYAIGRGNTTWQRRWMQSDNELTFMVEKRAADGEHDLRVKEAVFHTSYGFNTRKFDAGDEGTPTFRMAPGETLEVMLYNDLDPAHNVACSQTDDEYCETSVTNMHTHGLHVSSKGVEDGLAYYSDDIFAAVQPGESQAFKFSIPASHMGGTHWYHPHHHHATALQAGGGAAGAIIVEDPPGYLPDVYANMIEKILFVSGHNLQTLQPMAVSSQSTLWASATATATTLGLDTNVFMVNGQLSREMTIASHSWHRLRFIYAAVEQSLELHVVASTGGAVCDLQLIAKDGVYLNTIPRPITTVILFPGARADVAMSCVCTTYPCTATLSSGARRRLRGGQGPQAAGAAVVAVDILTLVISETSGAAVVPLPEYSPQRPCYLADLRSATPATSGALNLNGGDRAVRYNGQGESMTYANVHAGGTALDWDAITSFEIGTVYELVVTGANAHPLHIHIQPFQITAFSGGQDLEDGYFAVGDWHDTLLTASAGGGSTVTVRGNADVFTGKAVVHCHILEHEDEGMMGYFDITGAEGTTYAQAQSLDPLCYLNAYPSPEPAQEPAVDACADVTCPAASECKVAGTCSGGTCSAETNAQDGTACNDGDDSTTGDACVVGICEASCLGVTCSATSECKVAGTCSAGLCSDEANAEDGTICNDGDTDTGEDRCVTGECIGSTAQLCSDSSFNSDSACAAGSSATLTLFDSEGICASTSCRQSECCVAPQICSWSAYSTSLRCIEANSTLTTFTDATCAGIECTLSECCTTEPESESDDVALVTISAGSTPALGSSLAILFGIASIYF